MQPELLARGSGHSGDLVGCFLPNLGGRLSRRSPDSLREKGTKTWARGPFALRVLSARFQLLRTESLA